MRYYQYDKSLDYSYPIKVLQCESGKEERLRINYMTNSIEASGTANYWHERFSDPTMGELQFFCELDSEELLLVTTDGLYVSANAGYTWELLHTSRTYGAFTSLYHFWGHLVANTTRGKFHSLDNGRTWQVG